MASERTVEIMSYRLVDANTIQIEYPKVNELPCIYVDLPNGLDNSYHFIEPVKHGHWIKLFETEDDITARCSECGMVYTLGKGRDPNYCGTCGARMDEVEE